MGDKMNGLKLIYNYKDIPEYRLSFNELANEIFGISFESWYNVGGWNDRYICYSYIDKNKVVANVSISKMDIVWEGKNKKALQIGTVMTHPDYRNRGLSASLINIILEEHQNKYDFIYLFANKTVLDFYPKFGFKQLLQSQFSMHVNIHKSRSEGIRKLDILNANDFDTIVRLTSERIPISKNLGVKNDQGLLLFYCLSAFENNLYYFEDEDIIVIYEDKSDKLYLYDVISKGEICVSDIVSKISTVEIRKVFFCFTPDFDGMDIICEPLQNEDTLFIKSTLMDITKEFAFPITSHA